MRTLISNVKIVNEGSIFTGSIVILDDIIEEILSNNEQPTNKCDTLYDADGCFLIPGVIDEHVHFREPGLTDKATIHTESVAAAAGGTTSIMDMPNTIPQTTTLEAFNNKINRMASQCVVNYSCYMGATNDNLDILKSINPHRVCGIKVFMGSSTGNMLVNNQQMLSEIFQINNILIATHCEDQNIINQNLAKYNVNVVNGDLPIEYHQKIRSTEACVSSTSYAVKLAEKYNTQLHILHLSTASELKLFKSDDINSKRITAEVCVGYLRFTADDYKQKGSLIKVNPAIKDPINREKLIEAINDNVIDTIATDHAPHLKEDKHGGALKAKSGMPIIQYSLLLMLELVTKGYFTLPKVVEKMCHAPSLLYQIHKRGFIKVGYKADIVIIRDNVSHKIESDDIKSKCKWSPVTGDTVNWLVERTYINGHLVYDGKIVDENYRGEELIFR